ncbi:unnamed protein product [Arabidopsis halleri]
MLSFRLLYLTHCSISSIFLTVIFSYAESFTNVVTDAKCSHQFFSHMIFFIIFNGKLNFVELDCVVI